MAVSTNAASPAPSTATSRAAKKVLKAKDIVLLAVFGLVTFVVMMAISMVCSFSADTAWWTHAISSIPAGIVWVYLMKKVPKTGAALIAGAVMAILGLLMGMFWTGPIGMIIGAVLCEAIMIAGKRSNWAIAIGFAVFVVCWWFGQISLILLSGESYVQMILDMGMSADYGWGLVNWVSSPLFPICGIVTFIAGLLGTWLGIAIFKKHFAKING